MIIFISNSPFLGGAEHQLLDLISGLEGTYKIVLICSRSSPLPNKLPKNSIKIEYLELGSTLGKFRGLNILDPSNISKVRQLKRAFSRLKVTKGDLVVTNDYKELILVGIVNFDFQHMHFQHPRITGWLAVNPIIRRIVVMFMNKADMIVTVSNAVSRQLQDLNVASKKIRVIYNGIDETLFTPPEDGEKVKIKQKLGLNGKKVVGINARVNAGKGYELLIRAFSKISNQIPEAFLLSVGGGNKYIKNRISKKVKDKGLGEKVKFLGEKPRSSVPEFYKSLDVYSLPSDSEGMPLTVIEAMHASLPVVATNVGGIPEQVVDGRSGYLVDVGDADTLSERIITLLEDETLAKRMGREGREIAIKKFTKKRMIRETISLFDGLKIKKTS